MPPSTDDLLPRRLILTCEHGGHQVPANYAVLFEGHEDLLASHRGWDPGALDLARKMAHMLRVPLYAATVTRLLVDLNRSIGHSALFSSLTRSLPRPVRDRLLADHYQPHRDAVVRAVAAQIADGVAVLHVAVHSFTPVLGGVRRDADVAFLYDPRRPAERGFAMAWQHALALIDPGLRLRRNYPYRGRDDGLTARLRKLHPDARYLGIELEVNQGLLRTAEPAWGRLGEQILTALRSAMA